METNKLIRGVVPVRQVIQGISRRNELNLPDAVEIANSNERRRMQSINSGFQALKMLIPNGEGEKLPRKVRPTKYCLTNLIK